MSTRRDFLKTSGGLIAACCGVAALGSVLESCASYKRITAFRSGEKLAVKKSDFGEEKFAVINAASLNLPADVFLAKQPDGNYTALLMLCTHKQCDVKPNGKGTVLFCPCHGSEFSSTGQVLKSPAEKSLTSYKVITDELNIYILTQ